MLTPKETEKLIGDVVNQVNGIIAGLVKRIEALEAKIIEAQEPRKPGRPRKEPEKDAA